MSTITVISGTVRQEIELTEGEDLASVVARIGAQFNIPDTSTPLVDNEVVEMTAVLADGSEVVFSKPTGSKGL